MAVLDVYTDSLVAAGKNSNPALTSYAQSWSAIYSVAIAAADDDLSQYRMAKNLDPNLIISRMVVCNTAITAGTSYGIGLYKSGVGGAAVLATVFASALDLSTAHLTRETAIDGMAQVVAPNWGKRLYEQAGHTILTRYAGYDLVLTATTVGSAAGTVTVFVNYIQG